MMDMLEMTTPTRTVVQRVVQILAQIPRWSWIHKRIWTNPPDRRPYVRPQTRKAVQRLIDELRWARLILYCKHDTEKIVTKLEDIWMDLGIDTTAKYLAHLDEIKMQEYRK